MIQHLVYPYNTVKESPTNRIHKKYDHIIDINTDLLEEKYFDFTSGEPTRSRAPLAKATRDSGIEKSKKYQ